jgi:hypothetical protein
MSQYLTRRSISSIVINGGDLAAQLTAKANKYALVSENQRYWTLTTAPTGVDMGSAAITVGQTRKHRTASSATNVNAWCGPPDSMMAKAPLILFAVSPELTRLTFRVWKLGQPTLNICEASSLLPCRHA